MAPPLAAGRVGVHDVAGDVLPVHLDALGCASPTTTGTLLVSHPFYDVMVGCDDGSFAARTGASHPVTALAFGFAQNVIYGGAGASPRTSDVTWRFHDQGVSYLNPTGGAACIFDPPDTPMEPNSIGIEEEWVVSPAPGITCTLREEIVAFGTTAADSGVRLTLSTTNLAGSASDVNVGVRWQIDYQNAIDDGPWFATVTCDPPTVVDEWSTEHEFLPGEMRDFYRIQNNQGFPTFSNVTSTTAILGIPDTDKPDRLVFGRWPVMNDSSWNQAAVEGACCPDDDSAVFWYHGFLPQDGDIIAPGDTKRHSVVIFSSADNASCGDFTPGCQRPSLPAPVARDPDDCNPGILVAWDPATFHGPSGTGVYNIYRSDVSCADAVARGPFVTGLTTTTFWDPLTLPGQTYFYVVEAEDDQDGTECPPAGPFYGGAVTRLCTTPTTDYMDDVALVGLGPVLRVRHSGDAVTVDWTRARAFLPFEHVHLLKAWRDPEEFFRRVNREADISRSYTETDRSARLQFFDLRLANKCEGEAGPEYPAGIDP